VSDVFDEVEEQLRSEQYMALARRAVPWILGALAAAFVIALGVYGYLTYQTKQAGKAAESYGQALETYTKGDKAAAYKEFQTVIDVGSGGYKALALMQQGAIRLEQDKTAEAVVLFDAAAKAAPNLIIGDVARLKSAFALMDTAPYSEIEKRLKPLTEVKHPYRATALEALALAKIGAGKVDEAKGDLNVLTLLPDAPDGMRQRANAAIALIDAGTAKSMPEVAKAAMALPKPIQMPAGAMIPGLTEPQAQAGAAQ
jgi:hypothetical protein